MPEDPSADSSAETSGIGAAAANRRRVPGGALNAVAALVVLALVLAAAALGGAGLPPLGPALNPGTGVWKLAPEATGVSTASYALPGLHAEATVSFESNGTPHISTSDDEDLWEVIGYAQAKFRLSEMDLERREGSGTLAQIIGPAAVDSDELELGLGLRRAAERDWATMPAGPSRTALVTYTAGINAAIGQLESAHELPAVFHLLGYQPAAWTPVDTLVIQRLETQDLSYTTTAATYSHLSSALGPGTFADLFPPTPAGNQHPYDPGPYTANPLTPLPGRADPATDVAYRTPAPKPDGAGVPGQLDVRALLAALPVNEVHTFSDSNAFAIAGSKTASGKPLQESDPHLGFTLPAIWYQVEATSPGYHFAGVTIPGTPVPLIGRTDSFSWGITDAQHPTTLFYLPKTDPAKPGQYFWRGAWHAEPQLHYDIAVKGAADVPYTVRFGAQGPILTEDGVTAAVWWGGTLPSQNITAVLNMLHAKDFTGFRAALQPWVTPPQNFVYADKSGTIGVFGVGIAPQVPGHDIGLPLPGDGSADVTGSIPYADLPHAQNPAQGFVVTSNQREVGADYPYQYDTSYNFPDQGWRADEISEYLSQSTKFTAQDVQRIQYDTHDQLAEQVLPMIVRTLKTATGMSAADQQVYIALSSWDGDMTTGSLAPTVFQTMLDHLVYLVFQPYYAKAGVKQDPDGDLALQPFAGSETADGLQRLLAVWLQQDPENHYLTPPGGKARNASDVVLAAFKETVTQLTKQYGGNLGNWDYGKHHNVAFPSLLQSAPLTGGPYARGGSPRTINAADDPKTVDGVPNTSTAGPSWRFVMDWGSGDAEGVYPGGQSESPLSPWYDNNVALWLSGRLEPVNYDSRLPGPDAIATWTLTR
jgi:penicillin G amidase